VRAASRSDVPDLQLEAIWCLTNITSGHGLVRDLIEAGILPTLRKLVENPDSTQSAKELAIWCYGNIVGDSKEYRDTILD